MPISVTAQQLLSAIERRLAEISQIQHALAVERAHLQQHTGPLRLGVLSPEAVLVHLTAHGVRLAGIQVNPRKERRARVALPRAGVEYRGRSSARQPAWIDGSRVPADPS
ncbi:MAG TPA: hypothetical protein VFC42_03720 [Methylomirabilota bacterium]|nr:hypothetical protein [Methylomirabilota bacterium]